MIKKIVSREDKNIRNISPSDAFLVQSKGFRDTGENVVYQGDIYESMFFGGSVTKTKTIKESIDLDIHKEPCDTCDEDLDVFTNKFTIISESNNGFLLI